MWPFVLFLAWRLLWALGTRTFFVADEFFQSVEVAHAVLFGAGQLTWEWTAASPVRSWLHPLLYAGPLWLLREAGLDSRGAVVAVPLVVQAVVAAVTDLLVLRTGEAMHGKQGGRWSAVMHTASWGVAFMSTRTLSNSVESMLVMAVLRLLAAGSERAAVCLMVVCCFVRPSSAALWPLWLLSRPLLSTLLRVLPAALLTALVVLAIDSYCYGRLTVTPLNFVLFNLASSSHYGTHPWHWYLSSGIPTLAGPLLPLLAAGLWSGRRLWIVRSFWIVAPLLLSLVPHKEFRFLLPSLSVAILVAGPSCAAVWRRGWPGKTLVLICLAANVGMAAYLCVSHQAGPIAATDYLRTHAQPSDRICYLAPCHSIPGHARLHLPDATLLSLECDPPLDGSPTRDSASDLFFRHLGRQAVERQLETWRCDWVVAFEPAARLVSREAWKERLVAHHAHWPSESRHGKTVTVFATQIR